MRVRSREYFKEADKTKNHRPVSPCNFTWKYNDTPGVSIDKLYRVALSERSGLINIAALSYLTFIDTENDNDVWTALYSQEMKNIADYALSFSNIDIC